MTEHSIPISDEELLRRFVTGLRPHKNGHPRWVVVGERLLTGSTYSRTLCRRFGADTDERVRRR